MVALVCVGVLGMAMGMTPSERGLGTHEQLNLPSCGWIAVADLPCFTCGMTTSFSHAVRGQLLQSIFAQPLGFLLAIGTAMTMLIGLYVAATGSQVALLFGTLWNRRTMWLMLTVAVGAWVYKMLSYKEFV